MTDKHTPGPWFYDGKSESTEAHIVHVADGEIAQVFDGGQEVEDDAECTGFHKTCSANACLIATAPELLAALQDLVKGNYGQPSGVTVPALDKARAAIAKAQGGAS